MLNHMKIHHYPRLRRQLLTALVLGLGITPLVVTAGIYKWTDEQGNVHYGSQRPADKSAEKLNIKTGDPKPYADPYAPEEKKEKAGEDPNKKGEEEKKPEAAKPKPPEPPKLSRKEKKGLCEQARKNLATIVNRGRVRVKDEKGNTRHLTDTERAKQLAAVKKNVSKYCR